MADDTSSDPLSRRPDLVVCFDRDYTVSTSPPPVEIGPAVPLAWVKFLAHDRRAANVDVWATGNQRLREEAAIPGTVDAVACWKEYFGYHPLGATDGVHHYSQPVVSNGNKPQRRDGLRIVADLYRSVPDTSPSSATDDTNNESDVGGSNDRRGMRPRNQPDPTFVVVDDAALRDMHGEGFESFLPWLFCVLVEDTGGQPEVFEDAAVSLPLTELPESTVGEEQRVVSDEDEYRERQLAFTNASATGTGGERTLRASHYDPTLAERES